MDGIHDLGGKHGFGRVDMTETPPFPARWQASVFAMMRASGAAGAIGNTDRFRHAIERIEPAAYLEHGYYGRWLGGVETLLVESGLITRAELDARAATLGAAPDDLVASRPEDKAPTIPAARDAGAEREPLSPPAFAVGDHVHTSSRVKATHTRLPAYARHRTGVISRYQGCWVYPDTNAHGDGECATHLYSVTFDAEALWGSDAEAGTRVSLDLFEPYLARAPA